MVTPSQAEELLVPLVVRAHALRVWPQAGFVDLAAEYLVRKLELDQPARRLSAQHRMAVERCKWIDDEVFRFLEAYPDALGVELGAGLSTRFQRLSARIDWPRFAWADVDTCDVIDCADLIFPRTDNYRLVACDIVSNDWLKKSGWTPGRPLVVVIETLPDGALLPDVKNIFLPLFNLINENCAKNKSSANDNATNAKNECRINGSPAPIHLILGGAEPALQKIRNLLSGMLSRSSRNSFFDVKELLRKLDINGHVLNEQDFAVNTRGPLMRRLTARIYRRITRKCFCSAVHFRLDADRPPSEQPAGVTKALATAADSGGI